MRDLLDGSTLRRVNFIEIMLGNDDWWKMEDIASALTCSESTVKSDIDYFRISYSEDFHFVSSKQNGIRLKVSQNFQMDSFYQRIMKECLNVQLINLLFSESLHTLEEYADAMYTSVSSVKRSIEQVKKVIAKYGLDLQQKPLRIIGKEKQILFFYGVFFWEEYGTSFLELNYSYIKKAFDVVTAFKEHMELSLSATLISKITIWATITFERLSKGHHMEENYTTLLPVSTKIQDFLFEHTIDLPFPMTKKDILFASFFLEMRYHYFSETVIKTNSALHTAYKEIDFFLETLSKKTAIPLENKQNVQNRLFSQFINHLEFKGHNFTLVDRTKIALINNEGLYTCFLNTAQSILKQMDKTVWTEINLSDPVDFFYVLVSTWDNLTTEVFKQRKKINTLIISQFGLNHEKFLKELTSLRFPYALNSYLFTEENYYSSKIDLILTDHEVERIGLQVDKQIPVIGISYSPSNQNWQHLKKVIEKLFHKKQNEE